MQRQERTGLCQPAVLAVVAPLVAAASAGLAALLDSSWQQTGTVAVLVPWTLSTALGLRVLGAALREQRRRAPARTATIDLRDRPRPRVPIPRQDSRPLDDVPKGGRGAP